MTRPSSTLIRANSMSMWPVNRRASSGDAVPARARAKMVSASAASSRAVQALSTPWSVATAPDVLKNARRSSSAAMSAAAVVISRPTAADRAASVRASRAPRCRRPDRVGTSVARHQPSRRRGSPRGRRAGRPGRRSCTASRSGTDRTRPGDDTQARPGGRRVRRRSPRRSNSSGVRRSRRRRGADRPARHSTASHGRAPGDRRTAARSGGGRSRSPSPPARSRGLRIGRPANGASARCSGPG